MNTSFWTPYISDGTIKAICWTLIHSLWIGMIIALLAGIVISATRKSAAALRYRLLCGLLVVFVCAIGVTYSLQTIHVPPPPPAPLKVLINGQEHIIFNQPAAPQNQTLLENVQAFLNQNTGIIFLVWLLFFVLKSLRMISGLLYIQRIRNYKVHEVAEEFKHRIELFAGQIGIRQTVRLVQSELVKVPVAVGWLKPVILLPMGILLQLSPEQLNSILWHELAHIRRRDYMVNILQGLVETVFFFNPGLLWLSSLIRAEREACCDDIVLSRTNRRANYLEALLSFGNADFKQTRLVMSIGSGNQLRDRLKRMVSQENKRLSVAEKAVLAIGFVLLTAFSTISKDGPALKHLKLVYTGKSGKVAVKNMTVSIRRLPNGRRLDDLKPNSREKHVIILTDTAIRFVSILFKQSDSSLVNNDFRAMDDKGNKYHFVTKNGKLVAVEMNSTKIIDNDLPDYEYMVRNIGAELAMKKRVRGGLWIAAAKQKDPGANYKGNGAEAKKYGLLKDSLKTMDPTAWKMMKMEAMYQRRGDSLKAVNPEPRMMKIEAMRKRALEEDTALAKQVQRCNNVIADLVKAGAIANAADVKWFGLSDTELIVNGKKQTDALQKQLMAKYGVSKGNGLYYGPVQMQGTGIFIDREDEMRRSGSVKEKNNELNKQIVEQSKARNEQALQALRANQEAAKARANQEAAKAQAEQDRDRYIRKMAEWKAKQEAANQQMKEENARNAEQWRTTYKNQMALKQQRLVDGSIKLTNSFSNIIADLVSDKVVGDKSDVSSFNLTNTYLMVNGVKQSGDLHQKLKSKYLSNPQQQYELEKDLINDPKFGFHYDAVSHQMGIGITSNVNEP